MSADIQTFGTGADGRRVDVITITGGGLTARVLTRGALLQDLRMEGVRHALTLGSPKLAAYEGPLSSYGGIVGPVVNRIGGASAEIAGKAYGFEKNLDGKHVLHSGSAGTHRHLWDIVEANADSVTLGIDLPDGQGGFPGNRRISATYACTGNGVLSLKIAAETDAPTLMNVAHHGYWNLGTGPDWGGHRLRIAADQVLETEAYTLPTGQRLDVAGTGFDFRETTEIKPGLTVRLDNNFCLAEARRALTPVLWLEGPTGIAMEVATTEPGLQVYDNAGTRPNDFPGHNGVPYGTCSGLAIEPQFWPDAPNHPDFPPILLEPGNDWLQETEWRFTLPG